jgi:hypothetical protein
VIPEAPSPISTAPSNATLMPRIFSVDFSKKEVRQKMRVGREELDLDVTVGDEEEIETPAGLFKAVKVTGRVKDKQGTLETSIWYARGVGAVKAVHRKEGFGGAETLEFVLRSFDK